MTKKNILLVTLRSVLILLSVFSFWLPFGFLNIDLPLFQRQLTFSPSGFAEMLHNGTLKHVVDFLHVGIAESVTAIAIGTSLCMLITLLLLISVIILSTISVLRQGSASKLLETFICFCAGADFAAIIFLFIFLISAGSYSFIHFQLGPGGFLILSLLAFAWFVNRKYLKNYQENNEEKGSASNDLTLSQKRRQAMITEYLPIFLIIALGSAVLIAGIPKFAKTTDGTNSTDLNPEEIDYLSVIPEDASSRASYLAQKTAGFDQAHNVSITSSVSLSVEDISGIKNESLINVLSFYSHAALDTAVWYPNEPVAYGEPAANVFPDLTLLTDPVSSDCTHGDTTGSVRVQIAYGKREAALLHVTGEMSKPETLTEIASSPYCTPNNVQLKPDGAEIEAVLDGATERIVRFTVRQRFLVNADLHFTDDFEPLGDQKITFTLTCRTVYDVKYTGAFIDETVVYLDKNESCTLSYSVNVPEGTDYKSSFYTTAPEIVSVDSNGRIKALAESDDPVGIVLSLTYDGITYSDFCEVWVAKEPTDKTQKTQ